MGTVRFVLRIDKPLKDGTAPVQGTYSFKGVRKYFKTNERLRSENWNAVQQCAVYLDKKKAKELLPIVNYNHLPASKEIEEINDRLIAFRKQIKDIETRFELDKNEYECEDVQKLIKVQNVSFAISSAPKNELIDFIDQYIKDHSATREAGSLSVYKSLKKHLIDFRQVTKRKLTFKTVDYAFFQAFQNFLLSITKIDKAGNEYKLLNNTTVAKQLSTIKTFLNYAKRQGISVTDKYKDFKIKKESLEVIALTNEEFETLYYLDLSNNKKLAQVRDVFCFSCCSGLRYSDLSLLKREHIKSDEIRLTVKKTKELLTIPLMQLSQSILNKYQSAARPLPVISNQKMNLYLKQLCKIAGIVEPVEIVRYRGTTREVNIYPKYELIGCHTGRKTFATLSLEKGMSAEEVMAITGHKDYKSFQRYVKVTEQRKKVVMLKAWGGGLSAVKVKII